MKVSRDEKKKEHKQGEAAGDEAEIDATLLIINHTAASGITRVYSIPEFSYTRNTLRRHRVHSK